MKALLLLSLLVAPCAFAGYLGIDYTERSGKVVLTKIDNNSPAEYYGLKVGDIILRQYISLHDRVVPTIYQLKLWEALGRPPRLDLECAHYSSYFHGNAVMSDIANTVKEGEVQPDKSNRSESI